jgi:hypothetical protein
VLVDPSGVVSFALASAKALTVPFDAHSLGFVVDRCPARLAARAFDGCLAAITRPAPGGSVRLLDSGQLAFCDPSVLPPAPPSMTSRSRKEERKAKRQRASGDTGTNTPSSSSSGSSNDAWPHILHFVDADCLCALQPCLGLGLVARVAPADSTLSLVVSETLGTQIQSLLSLSGSPVARAAPTATTAPALDSLDCPPPVHLLHMRLQPLLVAAPWAPSVPYLSSEILGEGSAVLKGRKNLKRGGAAAGDLLPR